MARYPHVEAFVLCGGGSSRMGRDKGLLELEGLPLVVRTAKLAEPLVRSVTLVGTPERYAGLGFPAIDDRTPAMGPLSGIVTALSSASSPWSLILACDLPYLTAEWLDWLLARAGTSAAQAVVPRTAAGLQPLAAVYRKECAGPLEATLGRGTRKVIDALGTLSIEIVEEREWRGDIADERILANMNTPEDYERARARGDSKEVQG